MILPCLILGTTFDSPRHWPLQIDFGLLKILPAAGGSRVPKSNAAVSDCFYEVTPTRKIHHSPQRHRGHREISGIDECGVRSLRFLGLPKNSVIFIAFQAFSVNSVSLW
jgi:hypothetical protein